MARLHAFAKAKGGRNEPAYFAIVRRGLNEFEKRSRRVGVRRAAAWRSFDAIDITPAETDIDPHGQAFTSVRLGLKPDVEERIVDGFDARPGQFDETVALTGSGFLCTGIALDSMSVLTAAHCVCDMKLHESSGHPDRFKTVHVGLGLDAATRHRIDVRNTKFFSTFLGGTVPCGNLLGSIRSGNPDLAIVRVVRQEPMGVRPLAVANPTEFARALGQPFFVVGFGCSNPEQPEGRFVRCRSNSTGRKRIGILLRSQECTRPECAPGRREFVLTNTGTRARADSCAGDSGGPVVFSDPEAPAFRPLLMGITSRALDPGGNCGFGGIYGKAAHDKVFEWLAKRSENLVE